MDSKHFWPQPGLKLLLIAEMRQFWGRGWDVNFYKLQKWCWQGEGIRGAVTPQRGHRPRQSVEKAGKENSQRSVESLIHSFSSKVLRSSSSHFSLFVEEESKSKRGSFIEGFTESLDGAWNIRKFCCIKENFGNLFNTKVLKVKLKYW